MATKKKPAKKKAAKKKVQKRPVEILIGADGSVPSATHISIANNGGTHWKSADRKTQWTIHFICDPFDESIVTSPATGKTRILHLNKKVTDGDQFNYHVEGPLHPRKNQVKTSTLGGIVIDA
jgi:hypothetical protein